MAEVVVGTHMRILTTRLLGFSVAISCGVTTTDIELSREELCIVRRERLAARVSAVPSGLVAQWRAEGCARWSRWLAESWPPPRAAWRGARFRVSF
jgi:hypothetical protein